MTCECCWAVSFYSGAWTMCFVIWGGEAAARYQEMCQNMSDLSGQIWPHPAVIKIISFISLHCDWPTQYTEILSLQSCHQPAQ